MRWSSLARLDLVWGATVLGVQVFMRVVSMSFKELTEPEICGTVISERELEVKIGRKPLIDEH
jgi:hypothetical protein